MVKKWQKNNICDNIYVTKEAIKKNKEEKKRWRTKILKKKEKTKRTLFD